MKILVTGAAGFIGSAVCQKLLEQADEVYGIDNLNSYYDVSLKKARLETLIKQKNFSFMELDLVKNEDVQAFVKKIKPVRIIHLAAQAGVRYSLTNPHAYADSNLSGFLNVLEACRHHKVEHLVFASSSSVYGANRTLPYSEEQNVDHPLSLYAATKKANELMAHSYSHLYQIPMTGLRFFTVYGPWGRPDMVPYKFCLRIQKREPIDVYNFGKHSRDFTFIDDIVEGICQVQAVPAKADPSWNPKAPSPSTSRAPYRIYNIGNSNPVALSRMIELIEKEMGKKAEKRMLPSQPGDVEETFADISALARDFGFAPKVSVEQGVAKFVEWFRAYHQ